MLRYLRSMGAVVTYGSVPSRRADPLVNPTTKRRADEQIRVDDLALRVECARSLALAEPG